MNYLSTSWTVTHVFYFVFEADKTPVQCSVTSNLAVTACISGLRLRLPGWQRWQAPRLLQGSSTLHPLLLLALAEPVCQCCHFWFQNPLVLGHANSIHPATAPSATPRHLSRGAALSVAAWRGAASVDARAPAPPGGRPRRRNGEARETWGQMGDFGQKSAQTRKRCVCIVIWQTHTQTHTHSHMYVCMYVCMHVCPYVCMSLLLYVCTSVCLYVCTSVCLDVCTSVRLCVCMSVCLHFCMSVCVCVTILRQMKDQIILVRSLNNS